MAFRTVLFDLDGTLLDTLDDIADAGNAALEAAGFPTHPRESYREFIGEGLEVLCRRALPTGDDDDATVTGLAAAYREAYGRTWNVKTRPYDGVPELLDGLVGRGIEIAVLSNKPDAFTRRCVEHFLGRWPFRVVLGATDDRPRKPDPAGAVLAAELLGLPASEILYVGDTATDMETALAAGMFAAGVSWGFRPAEELRAAGAAVVVDHPSELLGVNGTESRGR